MPPVLIGAGIAAAGSVAGAAISSKAAKKASKAQAQSSADQIAATNANREYQYNLNAPTINQGRTADNAIAGLLNIGGDQAASNAAFQQFQDSSGYQNILNTGLGAVNSNAYARGMGDSGATLKALQDRGGQIANSSLNQYLGQLQNVSASGGQARGLVAGIGTNATNSNNAALQQQATTTGNAALASAGQTNGLIQGLLNAGAYAYGSSYQQKNPYGTPPIYGGTLGGIY